MFNWLHTNIPNSVLLELGPLTIHWYGFMIAFGAGLGIYISFLLSKKYKLDTNQFLDIIFYSLIFGLIGDRLYYVIYNWQYYKDNLIEIPMFWQGGLAIYGAYIGGALAVLFLTRKYKMDFWLVMDILVIAVSVALAFGRWGNYFNQELFGLPTNLPWGIPIVKDLRPTEFINETYFHPTFLYESLLMMVISLILLFMHMIRLNMQYGTWKIKKYLILNIPYGIVTGTFFLFYGFIRLFTEQLRLDYSPYFFGQRVNFWGAIILSAFGLAIVAWRIIYLAKIRKNGEQSGNNRS